MAKAASYAKPHSLAFRKTASKLLAEAKHPKAKDDPRWLERHAEKFSAWADAKDKALEHKVVRASKGRARRGSK